MHLSKNQHIIIQHWAIYYLAWMMSINVAIATSTPLLVNYVVRSIEVKLIHINSYKRMKSSDNIINIINGYEIKSDSPDQV